MRSFIRSAVFISLLISVGHPLSAAGAGAQGIRPPAAARASTTQQPADGGWPRAYVTSSGARLVLDGPKITSWLDQKRIATYAAVFSTPADQTSTALDWKDLKAALGAQDAGDATAAPTVFVRKKPAELTLLNGVAAYKPVTGTHLAWVSNTDSDVFCLGPTGTVYSHCDPHYPTYGYGARYGHWSGACTRGGAVYGPHGGAGYTARYNPRTGTCTRGAAAWGPGGARGAAQAFNPRTGGYAQTRQGANVFASWGSTGVSRGDQWARTARVTNRATGATT